MRWTDNRGTLYHQRFPGHSGIHVGQPSGLMCVWAWWGVFLRFYVLATEAEINWPWKLRTKKPPLEKSLWNLSRTWLVELYAVSRAVFPLKTPSWGEFWSGPSLGKRLGYQRKKFNVIADTVQPAPQYGQAERTGMVWRVQCPLSVTNNNILSVHGGYFLMSNIYKIVLQLN